VRMEQAKVARHLAEARSADPATEGASA